MNFKENIQPYIIKSIAVVMSMFYLAGPLHEQFNILLHNISHNLNAHESSLNIAETDHLNDDHSLKDHTHVKTHSEPVVLYKKDIKDTHTHDELNNHDHEHQIIDFIYSLFDVPDSDDSPDSFRIKVDKHIVFYDDYLHKGNIVASQKVYWNIKTDLLNGFQKQLEQPPKNS
ncbi:hypothetical protein GTQ40_07430 [Flavobacteriaceae bacterium R38]|nr:hypothetical protein [Flavobacteriaceae bacterium R38]